MQLEKLRKLGTSINASIELYYKRDGKDIMYSEFSSETKFNNAIEVLLCLGLIEPENQQKFKAKSEFKTCVFKNKNIKKTEVSKSFTNTLIGNILYYKNQEETMYNICISNLAYDFAGEEFSKLQIKKLSPIIKSGFDINAAKYWVSADIVSIESELEMQKYIGSIEKFTNQKMNTRYFSYFHENDIKIKGADKVSGDIDARAYNINMLIKDISNQEYHIPIYQRNYVWKEAAIDRLLNDIMTSNYINLNNVTFHANSKPTRKLVYEIIDGQQRLTTLFLILTALHRYLNSYFNKFSEEWLANNEELLKINQYIHRYLFDDEKLKTNFVRIEGNSDYSAFQKLIIGEECSITDCNTQIYKNYIRIYESISKMNKKDLAEFAEKFLNNVIFIITVDKESEEFTLFENLNTTSIPLSTIDLVKSYMLSLINEDIVGKEERFQSLFDEKIINALKVEKGEIKVDNFMRAYIRVHAKKLDKNKTLLEQYKEIHKIKKGSLSFEEINRLLNELAKNLELYKYLTNKCETVMLPKIKGLKIEDFIETIGLRDIYIPIMIYLSKMYMKSELSSNQIRKLLFELETFEIIFKICSYRGQSLSTVMDKVLMMLDEKKDFSIENFREILMSDNTIRKTLAIKPVSFERKFMEFEFKEQISKIVLTRITNYLKNNKKIELNTNDSVRKIYRASLEHIMPMNGAKWIEAGVVTEKEHQQYVGNIGNHLLLEETLNKTSKDKLFLEKMEIIKKQTHMEDDLTYRKGQEKNGFEIKELEEFNIETIKARQKFLTKLAIEIWR